ncbi:MAG: class II aldolase/adducin family protein [Rhodovibrionaceae bacterium]
MLGVSTISYAERRELDEKISTACRILAMLGLVRETTGHVSARIGDNRMLIRCRGKQEAGLAFTQPEAVRACGFDGCDLEQAEEYETPTELPIHGEIFRNRPEAMSVLHAHPRASLICTLAGLDIKPLFGSFDPNAMYLAMDGIPIFPKSVLIRSAELGQEVAAAVDGKKVGILRGHGIVSVGSSVEEATINAIRLETLAGITLEIAKAGGTPAPIDDADLEYFRKLRESQDKKAQEHGKDVFKWTWRHYCKLLEAHEGR